MSIHFYLLCRQPIWDRWEPIAIPAGSTVFYLAVYCLLLRPLVIYMTERRSVKYLSSFVVGRLGNVRVNIPSGLRVVQTSMRLLVRSPGRGEFPT